MLKKINILFKKYLGYIILLSILIFISYRLFNESASSKLLKKELNQVTKQKDSLIQVDNELRDKYKDLSKTNIHLNKQKMILSKKLKQLLKDLDDKIEQDEKNILDIDNITERQADSILSNYKFKPFKKSKN